MHRRARKTLAHWPIWFGVGFAAILAISLFAEMVRMSHHNVETLQTVKNYFTWIEAGSFKVPWGYFFRSADGHHALASSAASDFSSPYSPPVI